jgi:ribosomal protein L34E
VKGLCQVFLVAGRCSCRYNEAIPPSLPTFTSFFPRIPFSSPSDLYPSRNLAMAQRVTLRKRQPYNTTSSRRRIVKTPGGVLRYHHIKKLPTPPKCGDCGSKLSGVRTPSLTIVTFLRVAPLICTNRSLPYAHANTQLCLRRKNTSAGHMGVRDAVAACVHGAF